MERSIDVCLTHELIHHHDLEGKIVVVVDVFRATSCMLAGFAHGVKSIKPVLEIEECLELQKKGYLAGGERHAKMIDGFDLDNSPFSYMEERVKGRNIAITTTNGTLAINKSMEADEVLVASFSNLTATAKYLRNQKKDVLVVCAGWKGRPGLEDILFGGALSLELSNSFEIKEDSTHLAIASYNESKDDMLDYLQRASHLKRLKDLGSNDIPFCLKQNQFDLIIHLVNGELEIKPSKI